MISATIRVLETKKRDLLLEKAMVLQNINENNKSKKVLDKLFFKLGNLTYQLYTLELKINDAHENIIF